MSSEKGLELREEVKEEEDKIEETSFHSQEIMVSDCGDSYRHFGTVNN